MPKTISGFSGGVSLDSVNIAIIWIPTKCGSASLPKVLSDWSFRASNYLDPSKQSKQTWVAINRGEKLILINTPSRSSSVHNTFSTDCKEPWTRLPGCCVDAADGTTSVASWRNNNNNLLFNHTLLNLNRNSKVRAMSSLRTYSTPIPWHDLIHTLLGAKSSWTASLVKNSSENLIQPVPACI